MRSRIIFLLGFLFITVFAGVKAYLLWPFPGSQSLDSLRLVHHLTRWQPLGLVVGIALLAAGTVGILRTRRRWTWAWLTLFLLLLGGIGFAARGTVASKVFARPESLQFAKGLSEALPAETLVMGIRTGDTARAYPLRLLAYHHQVRDVIGGQPILATY